MLLRRELVAKTALFWVMELKAQLTLDDFSLVELAKALSTLD